MKLDNTNTVQEFRSHCSRENHKLSKLTFVFKQKKKNWQLFFNPKKGFVAFLCLMIVNERLWVLDYCSDKTSKFKI